VGTACEQSQLTHQSRLTVVLINQQARFHPISKKAHHKGKTILKGLFPGFFPVTINH
jgi:hypothetical protein